MYLVRNAAVRRANVNRYYWLRGIVFLCHPNTMVKRTQYSPLEAPPDVLRRDRGGTAVEPRPRLLLHLEPLRRVLLQPLREPLPVQVQRRLERLHPLPAPVEALAELVR